MRRRGSTCCRRARTHSSDWNTRCDNIDKQYANLVRPADMHRDKEFQMFWANSEIIKPSIYAKPPRPVVTPKFKDRRPVYQAASEVAERCAIVSFDLGSIDGLMKLMRDDLALIDRGVAWCRYESGKREASTVTRKSASISRAGATSCTRQPQLA